MSWTEHSLTQRCPGQSSAWLTAVRDRAQLDSADNLKKIGHPNNEVIRNWLLQQSRLDNLMEKSSTEIKTIQINSALPQKVADRSKGNVFFLPPFPCCFQLSYTYLQNPRRHSLPPSPWSCSSSWTSWTCRPSTPLWGQIGYRFNIVFTSRTTLRTYVNLHFLFVS